MAARIVQLPNGFAVNGVQVAEVEVGALTLARRMRVEQLGAKLQERWQALQDGAVPLDDVDEVLKAWSQQEVTGFVCGVAQVRRWGALGAVEMPPELLLQVSYQDLSTILEATGEARTASASFRVEGLVPVHVAGRPLDGLE